MCTFRPPDVDPLTLHAHPSPNRSCAPLSSTHAPANPLLCNPLPLHIYSKFPMKDPKVFIYGGCFTMFRHVRLLCMFTLAIAGPQISISTLDLPCVYTLRFRGLKTYKMKAKSDVGNNGVLEYSVSNHSVSAASDVSDRNILFFQQTWKYLSTNGER